MLLSTSVLSTMVLSAGDTLFTKTIYSGGPVFTFGKQDEIGAEFSYIPHNALGGVFFQAQKITDGENNMRFASGFETGLFLGAELGLFAEYGKNPHSGLHFAPFFFLPMLSNKPTFTMHVATRFQIPFDKNKWSYATVFGLKLALPNMNFSMPSHGRPVRDEQGLKLPKVSVQREKSSTTTEYLAGRLWLEQARAEYSSIASFFKIAMTLKKWGAPESLVENCLKAANEETRHAKLSLHNASQLTGEDYAFEPLCNLLNEDSDYTPMSLALESLEEGVLGEGASALALEITAARTRCSESKSIVESLVDEECSHSQLANEMIAFCLRVGDANLEKQIAKKAKKLLNSKFIDSATSVAMERFGIASDSILCLAKYESRKLMTNWT